MVKVKVKENRTLCYNNKTYYPESVIEIINEKEASRLIETENVEAVDTVEVSKQAKKQKTTEVFRMEE